ncbi:MAG: hypothetical protein VYC17_03025 [Nitrospinota bacterium]|nr:hypothetical protein [Nitrospinota bacterium]
MPASLKRQMEMQNDPEIQAKKVTGTIKLSPELADKASKSASLFIIARPSGVTSGPPLAVKRLQRVELPHSYSIGQMNVMLEGINFEGKVKITARLDQDGIAQTSPGDIEGSITAQVGESNREIILNRLILGTPVKRVPDGPPGTSRVVKEVIPALLAKAKATTVSGHVIVASELKGKIPKNAVLFIFAREQGVEKGPPLAVKLFKGVSFPFEFSLSQQDTMMPGTIFSGKVTVTARIDQNADADSSLGDIQGRVDAEVGSGEKVNIVIDNILGG